MKATINGNNFIVSVMKHLLNKIGNGMFEILIVIGTFFSPAAPILLMVGLAILMDTVFAIWKVYWSTDEKYTSKEMRLGLVPKSIGYCLFVLTFYAIDYAIVNNFVHTLFPNVNYVGTKLVALMLVYIECTSVDESYYAVKGVHLREVFFNMLKTFRKMLRSLNETKKSITK